MESNSEIVNGERRPRVRFARHQKSGKDVYFYFCSGTAQSGSKICWATCADYKKSAHDGVSKSEIPHLRGFYLTVDAKCRYPPFDTAFLALDRNKTSDMREFGLIMRRVYFAQPVEELTSKRARKAWGSAATRNQAKRSKKGDTDLLTESDSGTPNRIKPEQPYPLSDEDHILYWETGKHGWMEMNMEIASQRLALCYAVAKREPLPTAEDIQIAKKELSRLPEGERQPQYSGHWKKLDARRIEAAGERSDSNGQEEKDTKSEGYSSVMADLLAMVGQVPLRNRPQRARDDLLSLKPRRIDG